MDQKTKVIATNMAVNTCLAASKILAGVFGHSQAILSDGVDSASDVVADIVIMLGLKASAKEADRDHPYGHERFECVASLLLSFILAFTALQLAQSSISNLVNHVLNNPSILTAVMAVVSIIGKESMYRYLNHMGHKLNSPSLIDDSKNNRNDVLSSIFSLTGIVTTILGLWFMDSLFGLIICFFILKTAYDIFKEATEKMTDRSADDVMIHQMTKTILSQSGVKKIDALRTRTFGPKIYVDVEIALEGNLTLLQGHEIAEQVHDCIEQNYPQVKHVMVHVNPYEEKR